MVSTCQLFILHVLLHYKERRPQTPHLDAVCSTSMTLTYMFREQAVSMKKKVKYHSCMFYIVPIRSKCICSESGTMYNSCMIGTQSVMISYFVDDLK